MNQYPTETASKHTQYNPFPWIYWLRIAQLVLTVLVIVLSAYAASQSYLGFGIGFSFWTIAWSLLWVPVATWVMPKLSGRYRPNIIVFVFESLSCLWWLVTFATMAMIASYQTASAAEIAAAYNYARYPGSNYNDLVNEAVGNISGALIATKVATAFAAFNWALFVATFAATIVRRLRQRRERSYQQGGNPNHISGPNAGAVGSDKV